MTLKNAIEDNSILKEWIRKPLYMELRKHNSTIMTTWPSWRLSRQGAQLKNECSNRAMESKLSLVKRW